MKGGSLHTTSFRRIHFPVVRYRRSKSGFTAPKSFRGFRETGSWTGAALQWRLMRGNNVIYNRPRSIYQYSNISPRLSGQASIFGIVFFVSKSLLGIERQKKCYKFAIFTRKPRIHVRILIYRTWPI